MSTVYVWKMINILIQFSKANTVDLSDYILFPSTIPMTQILFSHHSNIEFNKAIPHIFMAAKWE